MSSTPYIDVCGNTETTLGSNPTNFSYVSGATDTSFFPAANTTATLGPMLTPQIYAKDLDVLEIASSGQVVMSLQDQASVSFSNNVTNTITYISGANSNAINIQPTDASETTALGNLTTDSIANWQELSTTETLGIKWLNPVRMQGTAVVEDVAKLKATLDVCGATVLWSTLSVYDRAILSGPMSLAGNATLSSTLQVNGPLTTNGSMLLSSALSVQGNTLIRQTLDVCGEAVMRSNLSVVGNMQVVDMYASNINVGSINSTGQITFANEAIFLKGLDVSGSVTMTSTLSVYSTTTFQSTLDVSGATDMSSTLSVQGATYLQSSMTVQGSVMLQSALSVTGPIVISGSTSIQSTLDVLASTTLKSSLSIMDTFYVKEQIEIGSSLSVTNIVTLRSTMDVSGDLAIGNDLNIAGNLSVNESTWIDSSANIKGTTYITSNLFANTLNTHSNVYVDASATIMNDMRTSTDLTVIGTTTFKSTDVIFRNTLDVCGSFVSRNTLSVGTSTSFMSTLTVNGASSLNSTLIVSSTLAVKRYVNIGSTLSVSGMTNIASTLDVSGFTRLWSTLSVQDTTTMANTLTVSNETDLSGNLTVTGPTSFDSMVTMSSTLQVTAPVTLGSTLDVSGATRMGSTLFVAESADVCGNMQVLGSVTVMSTVNFASTVTMKTTMAVQETATFSTEMRSDFYRTLDTNTDKVLTLDASNVALIGDIDLVGTINTSSNMDALRVQDKALKMSYSPDGGDVYDGTYTNHESGIFVDGLPDGVLTDAANVYQKSFSWNYDPINKGTSWGQLGINPITNKNLPREPTWQLRGGSFKMANYRTEDDGSMFTMRMNQLGELEVWRSLYKNGVWSHNRVTRFGVTKTVAPISVISGVTVALGVETLGKNTLSIRVTSVTDTLYATKGVIPYYTASMIVFFSYGAKNNQYGINLGIFSTNTAGVVTMTHQDATGLVADTSYNQVDMRLTNQFGISAMVTAIVNPAVRTLDASSPVVVASATASGATLNAAITSYDIGASTTEYYGVLFVAKDVIPEVFFSSVTTSTPNTVTFTGTAKTEATAQTNNLSISTDISGAALSGSYYLYYVLYDPLNNRTDNKLSPLGPYAVSVQKRSILFNPLDVNTRSTLQNVQNYAEINNTTFSSLLRTADTNNAITISAWVKYPDHSIAGSLFSYGGNVSSGAGTRRMLQCPNVYGRAYFYDGTGTGERIFYNLFRVGEWNHVVWQKTSNTSMSLYVNNKKITGTLSMSTILANQPFTIGRYTFSTTATSYTYRFGQIDEYSVFNAQLTDAEVSLLYNNGVPGDLSIHPKYGVNCLAWWMFDNVATNGTSTVVTDSTGKGYDLTLYGSTLTTLPIGKKDVPTINLRDYVLISGNTKNPEYLGENLLTIFEQTVLVSGTFDGQTAAYRMFDGLELWATPISAYGIQGWLSQTGTSHTDGTPPENEWVIFDLGRVYKNINMISIMPYNGIDLTRVPLTYKIFYGTTSTGPWIAVSNQTPSSQYELEYDTYHDIHEVNFMFTPLETRYIRVLLYRRNKEVNNNPIGIHELEIYQSKTYPTFSDGGVLMDGSGFLTHETYMNFGTDLGYNLITNPTEPFTFSCWFKFEDVGDTTTNIKNYTLLELGALPKPGIMTNDRWRLIRWTSAYWDGQSQRLPCITLGTQAGSYAWRTDNIPIVANTWYHLVVRYVNMNGSGGLYVNASTVWINNIELSQHVGGGAGGANTFGISDKLRIGGSPTDNSYVRGGLKHIALWKNDATVSRTNFYSSGTFANGPADLNTTFSTNKPFLWYKFESDTVNYGTIGPYNFNKLYMGQF
jgi:UDP-3-O-[3-hydroxymyristoyl] glucosamine N-acyltransferase